MVIAARRSRICSHQQTPAGDDVVGSVMPSARMVPAEWTPSTATWSWGPGTCSPKHASEVRCETLGHSSVDIGLALALTWTRMALSILACGRSLVRQSDSQTARLHVRCRHCDRAISLRCWPARWERRDGAQLLQETASTTASAPRSGTRCAAESQRRGRRPACPVSVDAAAVVPAKRDAMSLLGDWRCAAVCVLSLCAHLNAQHAAPPESRVHV